MRYDVRTKVGRTEVWQIAEVSQAPEILIATFPFTQDENSHRLRANEYVKIISGQEFYQKPPTPEYIAAHTYAGGDIPRTAIEFRNEEIDELRTVLRKIARMVNAKSWGDDFEHLLAKIGDLTHEAS